MEERRKNKRLELEAKLLVKRLDSNEKEEFAIALVDVSRTGVGFKCEEPLQIGAVYETLLSLWNKDVLHAFIEIVRIEKIQDTFLYGSIFIGMPEADLQRITIYETMHDLGQN